MMSDHYGAKCKRCSKRDPCCCDMCTACIAELEHENCFLQDKIQQQDILLSELKETIEVFEQEALEALNKCRG